MWRSKYPRSRASPHTTRFVEVPIRVTVPPRMAENESGIRYRDGASWACCASPRKTGMKITTTTVLFKNGESAATTTQSSRRRVIGVPRGAVCAQRPISSTAPVFASPSPRTSMAATVTVAGLLNPARASSAFRTPASRRTTGIARAT